MLQWFIPDEMRCHQYQTTTASLDMQSHIQDKDKTSNQYIGAQLTEWAYTSRPLL